MSYLKSVSAHMKRHLKGVVVSPRQIRNIAVAKGCTVHYASLLPQHLVLHGVVKRVGEELDPVTNKWGYLYQVI